MMRYFSIDDPLFQEPEYVTFLPDSTVEAVIVP
jgi:hypothetical protein